MTGISNATTTIEQETRAPSSSRSTNDNFKMTQWRGGDP